ncbi:MAG: hypothetical protein WA741_29110 [Candidatus Sulfotelmatobacter sp.]
MELLDSRDQRPAVDMTLGFAGQLPPIEQTLKAAQRLMPYASLLQGQC